MEASEIREKFVGSLLGAALGDALGASWEGHRMATQREMEELREVPGPLVYTDDTHMTIAVAESLVECGGANGCHMAKRFVENYFTEPWRGYGPGPPRVFRLISDGEAWDTAATHIYPGGSFGNGAAMRVAPVGLFYWKRTAGLRQAAETSSIITHCHPLGVEGALLQARAVAIAVAQKGDAPVDAAAFLHSLEGSIGEDIYRAKLGAVGRLLDHADDRRLVVNQLGHGIEAFNSVPTALFSFLANHRDFASTVLYAISLGGDTDTIASMSGAVCGACLGVKALPREWLDKLENGDYLADLAERLWFAASAQGGE